MTSRIHLFAGMCCALLLALPAEAAKGAHDNSEPDPLLQRLATAKSLYQEHRNFACIDECNKIIAIKPDCADAWLYQGNAWQMVHKPGKALAAYKQFIANSKEPQPQYQTLIGVLSDQVKEEEEKHRKDSKDTYLPAVTQIGICRWSHTNPITVWIEPGEAVPGYRPEFDEALREALEDWSEATASKFVFVVQPQADNPDITVTWTADLHAPAFTAEAGDAQFQTGAKGIDTAKVRLLTVDPFKEAPLGKEALHNICLHEIGHALGLQGHSTQETDIMFPTLISAGLSGRDVNTLLALYSLDTQQASNLPAVDAYGRALTPAQQAERFVREGSNAAVSGDYKRAKDLLEKALTLGSKDKLARSNLCASCNNLAVSAQCSSQEAISLFHEALYWVPDDDLTQKNLDIFLANAGKDAHSFSVRKSLGQLCLQQGDIHGAVVELRAALKLKDDPAVRKQLSTIEIQAAK